MDAFDFKGIARGLFLGVRDVRLATTPAHIKAATDTVKERRGQMGAVLDRMIKLTTIQSHRDRMHVAKADADKYVALSNEIVALKNQIFPLQPRTPNAEISDAAIAKIASAHR